MNTGEIMQSVNLPAEFFGEGITSFDNKIIQLTWKEQVAFIYDKATFKLINKFNYPINEGWGITYNGNNLIMSDGSAHLYFLSKDDISVASQIEVCDDKGPVNKLNELEYIEGEIWANVWETDYIIRINPNNGEVTGKIDLSGLLKPEDKHPNIDVLNGIAYDPKSKHIIVTGKNWPKLFEITVYQ
jgi:glutamine cyclotransferase